LYEIFFPLIALGGGEDRDQWIRVRPRCSVRASHFLRASVRLLPLLRFSPLAFPPQLQADPALSTPSLLPPPVQPATCRSVTFHKSKSSPFFVSPSSSLHPPSLPPIFSLFPASSGLQEKGGEFRPSPPCLRCYRPGSVFFFLASSTNGPDFFLLTLVLRSVFSRSRLAID